MMQKKAAKRIKRIIFIILAILLLILVGVYVAIWHDLRVDRREFEDFRFDSPASDDILLVREWDDFRLSGDVFFLQRGEEKFYLGEVTTNEYGPFSRDEYNLSWEDNEIVVQYKYSRSGTWKEAVFEITDMADAFYHANSERLFALANTFLETGKKKMHVRINQQDDFNAAVKSLPKRVRQAVLDCFSDSELPEWQYVDIDFRDMEYFQRHPVNTPRPNYAEPSYSDFPEIQDGVVGRIRIRLYESETDTVRWMYFTYYEHGEHDPDLLDEHWKTFSDSFCMDGIL